MIFTALIAWLDMVFTALAAWLTTPQALASGIWVLVAIVALDLLDRLVRATVRIVRTRQRREPVAGGDAGAAGGLR